MFNQQLFKRNEFIMKKIFILILLFLPVVLSGCAYNGFSVESQNQKFALMIQRFEFLRHNGIPVIKASAAIKKKVSYSKLKAVQTVRVYKTLKKQVSRKVQSTVAQIHGSTTGLPVLTVDFKNKPLWNVLQDVSNSSGYVFSTQGVALGRKVNLKGRYNFAVLIAKLFDKDNTTVNIKTKKVKAVSHKEEK